MSRRPGPPSIDGLYSLKVDNISYHTAPQDLRRLFEKYGDIGDIHIPRDRYTKQSKGFGFVRFFSRRDAEYARDRMDGRWVDGREIRVAMARYERPIDERNRNEGYRRRSRTRSRSRSRSPRRRRSPTRSRSRSDSRRRSYSRERSRSRGGSREKRSRDDKSPVSHDSGDDKSPLSRHSRSGSHSPARSQKQKASPRTSPEKAAGTNGMNNGTE